MHSFLYINIIFIAINAAVILVLSCYRRRRSRPRSAAPINKLSTSYKNAPTWRRTSSPGRRRLVKNKRVLQVLKDSGDRPTPNSRSRGALDQLVNCPSALPPYPQAKQNKTDYDEEDEMANDLTTLDEISWMSSHDDIVRPLPEEEHTNPLQPEKQISPFRAISEEHINSSKQIKEEDAIAQQPRRDTGEQENLVGRVPGKRPNHLTLDERPNYVTQVERPNHVTWTPLKQHTTSYNHKPFDRRPSSPVKLQHVTQPSPKWHYQIQSPFRYAKKEDKSIPKLSHREDPMDLVRLSPATHTKSEQELFRITSSENSSINESYQHVSSEHLLGSNGSELNRDSWIWFSPHCPTDRENFATRQDRFRSWDPFVSELLAKINRQDMMNRDIRREAKMLLGAKSSLAGKKKKKHVGNMQAIKEWNGRYSMTKRIMSNRDPYKKYKLHSKRSSRLKESGDANDMKLNRNHVLNASAGLSEKWHHSDCLNHDSIRPLKSPLFLSKRLTRCRINEALVRAKQDGSPSAPPSPITKHKLAISSRISSPECGSDQDIEYYYSRTLDRCDKRQITKSPEQEETSNVSFGDRKCSGVTSTTLSSKIDSPSRDENLDFDSLYKMPGPVKNKSFAQKQIGQEVTRAIKSMLFNNDSTSSASNTRDEPQPVVQAQTEATTIATASFVFSHDSKQDNSQHNSNNDSPLSPPILTQQPRLTGLLSQSNVNCISRLGDMTRDLALDQQRNHTSSMARTRPINVFSKHYYLRKNARPKN